MKKLICILLALTLCFASAAIIVSAANASAKLTGPNTVRAGDTITLSFKLNGSGLYGASGALSYDKSQLDFVSTSQKIASPWMVEFEGNNFVAYDNALTNPIKKDTEIFTITFKVKNLTPGTNVKVSFTGVTASDGSADSNIGTVTYSATIAEPMSTKNDLASLTVKNAAISPAFDPSVTSYTAEVPFSVSKLEIDAKGVEKTTVTVDSPNLIPGGTTTVKITVKAENGATKTYTITVKREQDPNYQASGNNNLSGITVDGFLLSPVFTAENTQYVIWLPYETESVTVSGTAQDNKASVSVEGGEELEAGKDNVIKVICTAENGETKEYTVIAKRAAAHGE
ncbi:MAG: cadherin-like beta sandwich domain-containing protein, partial [Clostridia bacterium]|nr:cadherin-like beta sandwich domain-containing protein [Clostridia bacterium]